MNTPALSLLILLAPLTQSAREEPPPEWWRIIGLIALTLVTIVVITLIFRPVIRAQQDARKVIVEDLNPPIGEPPPGMLRFPAHTGNGPVTDAALAAERLSRF